MKRFWLFLSSMVMAIMVASSLAAPHALAAQDCDTNAIIYCGATSPASFMNAVNQNKTGDLPAIYANFGLAPTDYQRFTSYARSGTAYQDGRIVVDGRTVATNAWSIGRQKFGYSWNDPIAGHTYYGSFNKDVFKSGSIPVMVLFDNSGVMQFAVLTACGNPITGDKVRPTYGCDLLSATPTGTKGNAFNFTTKASAGNGATISKVVYDFGDKSAPVTGSASSPVMHTYAQSGTYTARVTVYVTLPGMQTTTVTSAQCATTVKATVPTPTPTPAPTKPTTPAKPTTPVTTSSAPVTPVVSQATTPVVQTASAPMKGSDGSTVAALPNTGPGTAWLYLLGITLASGMSYAAAQGWLWYVRRLAAR